MPAIPRRAPGCDQAIDEGAEIILGSLFAHTVQAVGSVARPRDIPVIAFSTDASVAARGVYLLSFLPESDVVRVLNYAFSTGKRSFAALIPDNAYGSVVEAAFREDVARRGGRVVALERYASEKGKQADAARVIAQAARSADAIFIPDGADAAPNAVLALANAGVYQAHCNCSAPACGTTSACSRMRACRAPGMRRPIPPALPISRSAIAQNTDRTRCGPRPCPMTRPRWSRPWYERRGHSVSRKKC